MRTPACPRLPRLETAIARTLLFGWVLAQVAEVEGEWHPDREGRGAPTGAADRGLPCFLERPVVTRRAHLGAFE